MCVYILPFPQVLMGRDESALSVICMYFTVHVLQVLQ